MVLYITSAGLALVRYGACEVSRILTSSRLVHELGINLVLV